MTIHLMTPVLKLPAVAWVLLSLFFWIIAALLGPPEKFTPPRDIVHLFEIPVVVAKSDGEFEIVHEDEKRPEKARPLWVIIPQLHEEEKKPVQWLWGWDGKRFHLGLYRMHAKWTYTLFWVRFDSKREETKEFSAEDLIKMRPLLVSELNQRFEGGDAGDWFDTVLVRGIEQTSYLCVQNCLILLGWLLLLPAVVAVVDVLGRGSGE